MNMSRLLPCICLLAIVGTQCKTQQSKGLRKPTEKLALNKNGEAINKIVFLTYRVTYDSTRQQYDFKLTNKFFADGELNPNMLAQVPSIEPNYLYCEVTGKYGTQYNKVENPLQIVREYPADDESGALAKITIHQKEGEFTARFQYNSDVKYLMIKIPNLQSQQLKTIYYAQL
ncbi:hypothetical protein LX64_02465 [Chitinophaga skermanii]|uniref:Uncharacterized protein n=1 Tax=Chitinophaga skermanii TaxID=331697 RepID=A0A327QMP0_9BACT|nr:hypothetical protein [Chitinophaga skermanii]RAJ05308.1 hypothetical protein LX64_02465 [Chitinophaga skermanii]